MDMLTSIRAFTLSLLIGLLIGIERERSHPEGLQAMGVRTFMLIALLGAIAAQIQQIYISVTISLFTLGAILLGYISSLKQPSKISNIGLTTELSAGFVFCLGYFTYYHPTLALLLSSIVLLILSERRLLHHFTRAQIKPAELQATGLVILIIVSALLLLPNKTIDPWGLFNPKYWGLVIAIITGMQFMSYVIIRLLSNRLGVSLLGFLGGLVSSTAVFATLPKLAAEQRHDLASVLSIAILATLATLTQLFVILLLFAPSLCTNLIWPIASAMVAGIIMVLIIFHKNPSTSKLIIPKNPLDFKAVLLLSLFISVIFIISALVKQHFGNHTLNVVSFMGGLLELHGTSMVSATLFNNQQLSLSAAEANILLAILGSFVSKFALLWSTMRNRFSLLCSLCLLLIILAGFAGWWLSVFLQ